MKLSKFDEDKASQEIADMLEKYVMENPEASLQYLLIGATIALAIYKQHAEAQP